MRLAWFTPWPPQPSGIAGRSAAVLHELAARDHAIDVFVDETVVPISDRWPDDAASPGDVRLQSAHDFVWRQARRQYNLVIYQLGNSRLHEFIWPYLFRWPGLAVLHDARLHHARGRALLLRGHRQAYRAEFYWDGPEIPDGAAELAVHGFGGLYYYQWPMVRTIVESARLVATHTRGGQLGLAEAFPDRPIEYVALSHGSASLIPGARRAAVRSSWGFPPDAVVFGVFGGLTHDKRIEPILRTLAHVRARAPQVRLVLAGPSIQELDLEAVIRALGLEDITRLLGVLDDELFEDSIAAVDVSLNMRWPTALEMSGPWLQALAAGRPSILIDLPHLSDVPTLDPRTWRRHEPGSQSLDEDAAAIAVAVDILDEEHSLSIAIEMLAQNPALRERLGAAARHYWEQQHTITQMTDDYQRAIARAAALEPPMVSLPPHMRPDAFAFTGSTLERFGASTLTAVEELRK